MANTRSAEKRNRKSAKRAVSNLGVRSGVKTAMKKVREALAKNDTAGAEKLLRGAMRTIDKAASKGVIKGRAASRKVARLSKAVAHKISQPGA